MRKVILRILVGCMILAIGLAFSCANIDFKYTIDFVVDGEVVASAGTDSETISMPKDPTKDGYEFVGWYWDVNGSEEFTLGSIADQPLKEENNYRVYAKWKDTEFYFVKFAGSNGNEEMPDQKIPVGVSTPLNKNTFKPNKGEVFEGWEYDGKIFADGESVKDICEPGETITLYAQWRNAYYTICYDANGGTGTLPNYRQAIGKEIFEGKPLSFTPPKEYMTFDCWNTKADGTGIKIPAYTNVSISAKEGDVITLYAQWKVNPDVEVYYLKTVSDLEKLKVESYGDVYFILENDIDCGGAKLTPAAGHYGSFGGVFYGNGHVISNFVMQPDGLAYQERSLFGNTGPYAYIENLGLENFTITGYEVASFTNNNHGTIKNCYAKGTLNVRGWESQPDYESMTGAGFAVYNWGTIENSYFMGSISVDRGHEPNYYSQGFTDHAYGFTTGGTVKNCVTVCDIAFKGDYENARAKAFGQDKTTTTYQNCSFYDGSVIRVNYDVVDKTQFIGNGVTSASSTQLNTANYYKNLGWDSQVWNFNSLNLSNGRLPKLKIQN